MFAWSVNPWKVPNAISIVAWEIINFTYDVITYEVSAKLYQSRQGSSRWFMAHGICVLANILFIACYKHPSNWLLDLTADLMPSQFWTRMFRQISMALRYRQCTGKTSPGKVQYKNVTLHRGSSIKTRQFHDLLIFIMSIHLLFWRCLHTESTHRCSVADESA